MEISNAPEFGRVVRGTQPLAPSVRPEQVSPQQVNVLTGVRKKRKVDVADDHTIRPDEGRADSVPAVNTLSAGLVRKRPKG